jgi:hypothetical protein
MTIKKLSKVEVKKVINKVVGKYIAKVNLYFNSCDDAEVRNKISSDLSHLNEVRNELLKCKTVKDEYGSHCFVSNKREFEYPKLKFPSVNTGTKVNKECLLFPDAFDDLYLEEYCLEEFAGDLHKVIRKETFAFTADYMTQGGKLHLFADALGIEEIV